MLTWLLKTLWIALICTVIVFAWHLGTNIYPIEKHNAALVCVLDAQNKTGARGQEVLQFHASRFFKETRVWVQVRNNKDGSKSEILCHPLGGDLWLLLVDGRKIQLE